MSRIHSLKEFHQSAVDKILAKSLEIPDPITSLGYWGGMGVRMYVHKQHPEKQKDFFNLNDELLLFEIGLSAGTWNDRSFSFFYVFMTNNRLSDRDVIDDHYIEKDSPFMKKYSEA